MGRPSHDEFGHLTTAPAVARRLETPTWHSTRSSISPRYMSTVSTRVTLPRLSSCATRATVCSVLSTRRRERCGSQHCAGGHTAGLARHLASGIRPRVVPFRERTRASCTCPRFAYWTGIVRLRYGRLWIQDEDHVSFAGRFLKRLTKQSMSTCPNNSPGGRPECVPELSIRGARHRLTSPADRWSPNQGNATEPRRLRLSADRADANIRRSVSAIMPPILSSMFGICRPSPGASEAPGERGECSVETRRGRHARPSRPVPAVRSRRRRTR